MLKTVAGRLTVLWRVRLLGIEIDGNDLLPRRLSGLLRDVDGVHGLLRRL